MIKWAVDTNELDEIRFQLEGCASALDIMGDAMGDHEGMGVGFIANSMNKLAERLEKLMREAVKIKIVEEGEENGKENES